MEYTATTALSPLDGRYFSKVETLKPIFSEFGLIKYRLQVEIAWFKALSKHPEVKELPELSQSNYNFIDSLLTAFSPNEAQKVKNIEAKTNHDVKAVEYYLKDKFLSVKTLKGHIEFIHFACTSEDINNLAYSLMLKEGKQIIVNNLTSIKDIILTLAEKYAALPMLSHTHGQTASPTTLGKELANVAIRLKRQIKQLSEIKCLGKINGAVGNYNAHRASYPEVDWPEFAKKFVFELGLTFNPLTTQIEPHDFIAEILHVVARANTVLIDFARDIWSYISIGYFKQKQLEGEVGSSTMPHKVNPIDFENAEGNLGISNALIDHFANKLPISRLQRDLTDSTVLRNLGVVLGHSVLAYQSLLKGINKLEAAPKIIAQDLDKAWEVLAEPIQMIMRKHAIKEPYEQLKNLTRGKEITKDILLEFIESLDLPVQEKNSLKALTPQNYIGYAEKLTKDSLS